MSVVRHRPDSREIVDTAGRGFLESYRSPLGELPVLHLSGSPEEMGRQYGALVGGQIRRSVLRTVGLFSGMGLTEELTLRLLDRVWERLSPHTPARFLAEIGGVAAGARGVGVDVAVEDVQRLLAVTNFDMYRREERLSEILGEDVAPLLVQHSGEVPMSCTMFAVWGDRTIDGKMFADRNLDWISQTGIHEDRLITVYHPSDDTNGFVTMGYAGVIGALAGMNDHGIGFSEIGAFSAREELDGIPWVLLARDVLETAPSFPAAVARVKGGTHTLGYNYQIAGGDPAHFGTDRFCPRGRRVRNQFRVLRDLLRRRSEGSTPARWTGPEGEVVEYGLPLRQAVMRADMAFGETTRALQAADNGVGDLECDGDPRKGQTYLDYHKPMYDMIRAYETGDEYVSHLRGTQVVEGGKPRRIGPDEALNIAATVAHNTERLDENDWNVMSVVYAPTDLDFWVSYESCDAEGHWKNAPDSGYWRFNLPELLGAKP